MKKYFRDWPAWDEQVPIYDFRGYDLDTVRSVGAMFFTRLMPRADVIALREGELLILEFDKTMELVKISRLLRYADAIQNDLMRPDWRTRRITMGYVTPAYDARFAAECSRLNVLYIIEPEVS